MISLATNNHIDSFVARIYEGVTDDEAMVSALKDLGSETGCRDFNVVQMNLGAGTFHIDLVSTNDQGHPMFALLGDRANQINPYFRPEFATSIVGGATFANETLPRRELEKTEFYNDYLKQAGVNDIAGFFSVLDGGILNAVSIPRAAKGSFTAEEKEIYRFLAPHAIRAFNLRHKLGIANQQQQFLEQVLNQQSLGIVLFNREGELTWLNRSATETITRQDGLAWADGRLAIANSVLNESFQKIVQRQINNATLSRALLRQELFCIPKKSGLVPYSISLAPITLDQGFCHQGNPVVVGFIADPTRNHSATARQMVLQYGLTPAEGDVAVKISYGHNLEEIAQSSRHKVATTRNLLKRAFAKTGASRQAELSKIVWASAIPASLTGSHPDTSNP